MSPLSLELNYYNFI